METTQRPKKSYDFKTAYRAVIALMRDPKDVEQVFRIINALPGHSIERATRRLRRSDRGLRLLREQPFLLGVLRDRNKLAAMPKDSLGAAYVRFMDRENLAAQGLVDADSDAGEHTNVSAPDEEYVWQSLRDSHDLWHVITGYHGDLLGEPALQAFNFAQTWTPGVGFIVAAVFVKGGGCPGMRKMIIEGFIRGLRSGWLPGEDWLELLPLPLDEVRRRLKVPAIDDYTPVREHEALKIN